MKIGLKVFIQNEAWSKIKNRHNEKTFEHLGSIRGFYESVSNQFKDKEFNVGDYLPVEGAMEFIRRSGNSRNTNILSRTHFYVICKSD